MRISCFFSCSKLNCYITGSVILTIKWYIHCKIVWYSSWAQLFGCSKRFPLAKCWRIWSGGTFWNGVCPNVNTSQQVTPKAQTSVLWLYICFSRLSNANHFTATWNFRKNLAVGPLFLKFRLSNEFWKKCSERLLMLMISVTLVQQVQHFLKFFFSIS